MYWKLSLITALVIATGCQKLATTDARQLMVQAEANNSKPDGTPWDNGGGDVIPVWGPLMLPSVFSSSPYPDLVLSVITPGGDVREYSRGANKYGVIDSDCENRQSCRWEIEVPDSAYAVVVTDVDPGVNLNMSLDYILKLIKPEDGPANPSEAPLRTTRNFVTAVLFPAASAADTTELDALELQTRNWMESAEVSLVPDIRLPQQPRDGCRETPCQGDKEGINGSLATHAADTPRSKALPHGDVSSIWSTLTTPPNAK